MSNRELDAEVAEMMGHQRAHMPSGYGTMVMGGMGQIFVDEQTCRYCQKMMPSADFMKGEICKAAAAPYSSDIAAAMEVVEKMLGTFSFSCACGSDRIWQVAFLDIERAMRGDAQSNSDGLASTLPEAICKAALKSIQATTSAEGGAHSVDTEADSTQPLKAELNS